MGLRSLPFTFIQVARSDKDLDRSGNLSNKDFAKYWWLWRLVEARWVLSVLTPSTIVFLGDLIDEASEATPEEQARSSPASLFLWDNHLASLGRYHFVFFCSYVHRFHSIYPPENGPDMIYLPGNRILPFLSLDFVKTLKRPWRNVRDNAMTTIQTYHNYRCTNQLVETKHCQYFRITLDSKALQYCIWNKKHQETTTLVEKAVTRWRRQK